jgi:hypothetical protein
MKRLPGSLSPATAKTHVSLAMIRWAAINTLTRRLARGRLVRPGWTT